MFKENCKVTISSSNNIDKNTYLINHDINKKIIFYTEKDKTITTYNYKDNVLIRDNEKMHLQYNFKINEKTTNIINIKELNNTFTIELFTKSIYKDSNKLKIVYTIDDTDFTYEIKKEN